MEETRGHASLKAQQYSGSRVYSRCRTATQGEPQAYLGSKHAQDFAAFVVHNGLLDLVEQNWHREAALVIRVDVEVHVAQVSELLVTLHRVGNDVLAGGILVFRRRESPPFRKESENSGNVLREGGKREENGSCFSLPFPPMCQ